MFILCPNCGGEGEKHFVDAFVECKQCCMVNNFSELSYLNYEDYLHGEVAPRYTNRGNELKQDIRRSRYLETKLDWEKSSIVILDNGYSDFIEVCEYTEFSLEIQPPKGEFPELESKYDLAVAINYFEYRGDILDILKNLSKTSKNLYVEFPILENPNEFTKYYREGMIFGFCEVSFIDVAKKGGWEVVDSFSPQYGVHAIYLKSNGRE